MSDLNDFLNSISSISSETIDLPKWIRIKQIGSSKNEVTSETSEADTAMNQVNPSATSEDATKDAPEDGVSATSENNTAMANVNPSTTSADVSMTSDAEKTAIDNVDDSSTSESDDGQSGGNISKLLQMLSSESDTEMNLSTATEQLEDQLKALLQAGGAMKKKASKKSKKKTSKKSKKKTSKKSKKKTSKKSKKKMKSVESTVSNEESSDMAKPLESTTEENQTSDSTQEETKEPVKQKEKKKRKANPALKAFAELSKHVSTKLNIPNGPPAKKIAGQVKRDTAEKFPDLSSVEVMKKAMEHFDQHMEKYKKMI